MDESSEAWLLNQYRSAELRGAGVILRLGRLADSSSLRSNFTRHLRDEGVHAWLWTRTIEGLGYEVFDIEDPYQAQLGAVFGLPRTVEDLLALTLVSERRGVSTYEQHLEQPHVPSAVRKSLQAILKDERWHVDWIEEELNSRSRVDDSIAEIVARAEQADETVVSAMQEVAGRLPGGG